MKTTIVKTTCNKLKEAKNLSKILLDKKLAACIQIEKIVSLYNWQDKLYEEDEFLLNIKTRKDLFKKVRKTIIKNHSYKVPQVTELEISNISKEYYNYILENTKKIKS
ncbi:Divalent-cation tolerance protein CutA [Aliarcobacter thereius]|uniref:Divalent-cation tolerance protein CutA n=1 Tax=Aliarcobacter thereius TaxID=544718 RepID=A0A5R9H8T7_9BACT|nr:divalent-cation tolerance protein CutA [Aliarcobacter thereius]OCL88563.1 Divalent-cation tolerance protein CutA [Aliarcobacter thereius]TLS72502.1 divalent-cation tolerance protein CutA [Aliarcobacter thereius]TLT07861.1 divalent-cation tolerance protein CutA [Aliarcobacter thereius]